MACGAEYIVAEPTTITGSIGVFILFPKVNELMNEKLGIHMDTVRTNRYSASFTPYFPSSEDEKNILQSEVDQIYEVFLKRVSEARDMSRDDVNEVAQGRIWTGNQAKTKGLVDELGDLNHTIEKAASFADIEDYRIVTYPRIKDPLYQLIEELTGEDFTTKMNFLQSSPSEIIQNKVQKELEMWSKPQARMPMDVIW